MPTSPKETPEKRCGMCGCRLLRKRFNGRLEDFSVFGKRQFCSRSCANSRLKGGLSRKAFHAQARKQRLDHCEACSGTNTLHVHHVDEDWTNNKPSNLQTLCVFCHQFWHATHRRLGAKPSTRMPQLPIPWPDHQCLGEPFVSEGMGTQSLPRRPRRSSPATSTR